MAVAFFLRVCFVYGLQKFYNLNIIDSESNKTEVRTSRSTIEVPYGKWLNLKGSTYSDI